MGLTPADVVNRVRQLPSNPRELVSLVASFAVALTFLRFGAAHLQAERSAREDTL
jgi:hypothetical protein